jgi:hypothetical protein
LTLTAGSLHTPNFFVLGGLPEPCARSQRSLNARENAPENACDEPAQIALRGLRDPRWLELLGWQDELKEFALAHVAAAPESGPR